MGESVQVEAGFTGSATEDDVSDGCCSAPVEVAVLEPAVAASPCCGTPAQAEAEGSCCGASAKSEAVASGLAAAADRAK